MEKTRIDKYVLNNIKEILEKINKLPDDERKRIGINWSNSYDYKNRCWIPNSSMNPYIDVIDELIRRKSKETNRVKRYAR